ncbi:MAG TPA: hypothetical protein P5234_04890 [Thermoanaerobaculaceae bacterium]|nr:hypothetical protein [Thermoanaerobaculaceae bacterium]HRS15569.1 hypothetical protein [Thermoanaerobaculaceae bacterium]
MPDLVPHCPVHPDVPLEPRRRGWCCPVCARRVLSFRQWARPAEPEPPPDPVLARLPWLVATPLAGARAEERSEEARAALARTAAFATVRLASLLLLCEVGASPDRELAALLGRLALPGWGPWIDLLPHLARRARDRSSRFGHLLGGWALLEATGGIDLLRAMAPADHTAIELATVERLAGTLLGGEGPTLLRAVDPAWSQAIALHGAATGRRWRAQPAPEIAALPQDCRLVAWDGGGALPLEPFLLPGQLVPAGDDTFAGEPALGLLVATPDGGLYEGLGPPVRQRFPWTSPGSAAGEPGASGTRILRQEAATAAAAHARRRIAAIRARPWHAGPFVPRPEVEARLAEALRRPGRGVLVAGESGVGKTVLLARLAAHLLAEAADGERSPALASLASAPPDDPDVVALVAGPGVWARAGAESGRRTLARVVAATLGVTGEAVPGLEALWAALGASATADRRLGRRVWLLLDGLDEDEHGAELLTALGTAMPELAAHPWLRLVLTLDLETCRRLASGQGPCAWLASPRLLETFAGQLAAAPRTWLEIPPLATKEETACFLGASHRLDPARVHALPSWLPWLAAGRAPATPLQLQLDGSARRRLATPPAGSDAHALVESFLASRGETVDDATAELAGRLWAAAAPWLPCAELCSWMERWLAGLPDPSLHPGRCGPVETLLQEGLLVPSEADPGWPPGPDARVCLPHAAMTEALLHLAARRQVEGRPEALVAVCLAAPAGRWSLRHELAAVLCAHAAALAAAGQLAALEPLLCGGDADVAATALAGALRAAASRGGDLRPWLEAAARDRETCVRLLRACTVAGLDEAHSEAVAAWRDRLLEAAVAHVPLDPALRCRLAAARVAAAGCAASPAAALELLRDARGQLETALAHRPAAPGVLASLAEVLASLGGIAAAFGHAREAETALRRSVPLGRMRLAAEGDKVEVRRSLASALVTLSGLAAAAGRQAEAERLLADATPLVSALRTAEPERADHRRLWGRLLHASGTLARAQHRLQRAWSLLEEAVGTLAPAAGAFEPALARLEYLRAVADFADLAAEERATREARAVLEEGLRVLAGEGPGGGDPALAAGEVELSLRLAALARDRAEELELCRRARERLAPLLSDPHAPAQVGGLWRRTCERLAELEASESGESRGN